MKKLLKVTALLLVVAAMFAGCKTNAEPNDEAILFDKSEVSTDITESNVTFSAGNWVATSKGNYTDCQCQGAINGFILNGTNFTKYEFTMSENGTFTCTKMSRSCNLKYTKETGEITPEANAFFESQFNGKYSISGNTVICDFTEDADADELKNISFSKIYIIYANISPIKTNDDKTKYYGEKSDDTEAKVFYIMKK